MVELSICISYHHTFVKAINLILSIYKYPPLCEYEILLTGSHVEDGSQELLKPVMKPNVNLVYIERSLPFAAIVNLGVAMAQAPWILVCDDDIEFTHPDWYSRLKKGFQDDTACVSSVVNQSGWGLQVVGENYNPDMFLDKYTWVYGVGGCCFLSKKDIFMSRVGWYNYFGPRWGDDAEWQVRASKQGLKVILCTSVYVKHKSPLSFVGAEK